MNIFLVLLRPDLHGFHQSAEKASETSMTTTPMVSLTRVASACAFATGRYQQGGGLHNGVTRVSGLTNAVIRYAETVATADTPALARYITNGDHIPALFEFKKCSQCLR